MLPAGSIILWYGAIVNIPDGWIICDGAGGSPDLRNKFIVGAGDIYPVHNVGGGLVHTHTFTGDGHTHELEVGFLIASGEDYSTTTDSGNATGESDNGDSRPPYHALAYIMKT